MKWFRSNIRHGSRLALFALVVQLGLSFGHFHGSVAQAAPAIQSAQLQTGVHDANGLPAATAADQAAQPQPVSNHDPDQQPGDTCAICAVMAMANNQLSATPPRLLLPQDRDFRYHTTA